MPVETMLISSRLMLRLETGLDEHGNSIIVNRSYNQLKTEASNEDVKAVADALASLQIHAMVDVVRIDQHQLA